MNQTEHYQLKQWEKSDRILMDDFNENNQKIDAAIHGTDAHLVEAVAAEAAARQNGLNTLESKMATVCLRSGVLEGNVNKISLSLSGIDWSPYSMIVLYVALPSSTYCAVSCGGSPNYCHSADQTWSNGGLTPYNTVTHQFLLVPVAGDSSTMVYSLNMSNVGLYLGRANATLAAIGGFHLKTNSASSYLPAGSKFTMWGVR